MKGIHLVPVMILQAVLLAFGPNRMLAQTDQSHYSKVFGREKSYRIFLPAGYSASTLRYPVIYYFHGNTGSHEFDLPGVKQLADDNRVIVVAWNGRSVDNDLRPYNIGNHSNINYPYQFKDYFPELVAHIDSMYRTLPDRQHRAVIGHSMGGIMSFFIAGKYPDMICSAYNSKGSPEFFIGYPNQHTLYHVRHMFKNLHGVRLGFSSGTRCELKNLNAEVIQGALLEKGLDFQYRIYEGEHDLTPDQFRDAMNFTMESFRNPPAVPLRWHHADLYPDFDIWGYQVHSNLKSRGFIEMKGVTRGGLGIRTRAWQPDGITIPGVDIHLMTPPNYKPNTPYTLLNYSESTDSKTISVVTSDDSGRIVLATGPEARQFGIFQKNDPAEITFAKYRVNGNSRFLDHKKECRLSLELLNRGGRTANHITVSISSSTPGVTISNPIITLKKMDSGDLTWLPADFLVTAANPPTVDGSPFKVRFNLVITDDKNNTWEDEFDAAAYYKVPEFTAIGIDDGDSEIFGSGNGNNIAEPGETLMIYEISNGSHRLRLYYDDPYIDSERLYDEIQPDKWGDGYSLSSLIHISKDCPPGHQINFLACYEIKDWKEIRRDVTWGTFTITVGDPSAQGLLFTEPFEDSNLTSRGWYDASRLPISSTEYHGGKGSAVFSWKKGETNPVSGGTMRRMFAPSDSVYVDFWVKYSENYTGSDQPYHPHEFYLLTTENDSFTGPAFTHLTAYIEQNEGVPQLALQDGMNIDQSKLRADLSRTTENRAVCGCNGTLPEEQPSYVDCYKRDETMHWNGKVWKADQAYFFQGNSPDAQHHWHRITAFFKLNHIADGKGIADGVVQYWFDGRLLIDQHHVLLRTARHPDMKFNQFLIGPYIGDGSPVEQQFWVDDLTLSLTRPFATDTAQVKPNPIP